MKRAWAYVCASEYTSSRTLSQYCRKIYELGYLPVCPRLQDGQYLVLDSPDERSDYAEIVRDKLLRCPMLVTGLRSVGPRLSDSETGTRSKAVPGGGSHRSSGFARQTGGVLRRQAVCGTETDNSMNSEIGLAQKYGRICTTMQGLAKAVESGDGLVS